MAAAVPRPLSTSEVKAALREILDAMYQSEHSKELEQARRAAGNDMVKMMLVVFPLACKIQMAIISKYGLPGDGEGLVRFTHQVKSHELRDAEVAALYGELRSVVMPRMTTMAAPPSAAIASSGAAVPASLDRV